MPNLGRTIRNCMPRRRRRRRRKRRRRRRGRKTMFVSPKLGTM